MFRVVRWFLSIKVIGTSQKDMKMIIWFVIGIIGISLLGLNMVAVAVLGGCLAVMYYMFTTRTATAVASNDDEEEF